MASCPPRPEAPPRCTAARVRRRTLGHGLSVVRLPPDSRRAPPSEGLRRPAGSRGGVLADLASFLDAVHAFPAGEAARCGVARHGERADSLEDLGRVRDDVFPLLADPVRHRIESGSVRSWTTTPTSPRPDAAARRRWPEHVLYPRAEGRLAGVIDFGDLCLGDQPTTWRSSPSAWARASSRACSATSRKSTSCGWPRRSGLSPSSTRSKTSSSASSKRIAPGRFGSRPLEADERLTRTTSIGLSRLTPADPMNPVLTTDFTDRTDKPDRTGPDRPSHLVR